MVIRWPAAVPHGHVQVACTIRSGRIPNVIVAAANADTAVAARQSNLTLQGVRVILASPKSPGNIGSVARSAENFEVSDLWIVDPRCDPRDGEAHMLACGSPLMDTMTLVPTLQEALADTSASIGFTRRVGNTRLVHASLSQLLQAFPTTLPDPATTVRDSSWASERRIALVFGREESGLTANELSLCTHSCSIPTGPVQPSLNLSHAVCVVLSQLFEQRTSMNDADVAAVKQIPKQHQPAPRSDVESLINRWTELTDAAGLGLADSVGGTGSHGRKRRTAGHVKAVLSRAQVTVQELRVLHGLCSALLEKNLQGMESPARG
ncbi:MAG: rRNA methyltransferase [Trebouxia sp. A1-2]|nr:MAG: rRNA methyltransferase [Trebouxia sp. A1-2]